MRGVLLLVLAGCWTGSASPPPVAPSNATPAEAPKPMRFRVSLERTPCLGRCPAYRVTIHGDGRVEWDGISNVDAIGHVEKRVPRGALERLSRQVDAAQFFERNELGALETGPVCTTNGSVTTCSYSAHFCSDTTHAKISVMRGGRTHTVDNDHCDEKPGLDELEEQIDHVAGTAELVGG